MFELASPSRPRACLVVRFVGGLRSSDRARPVWSRSSVFAVLPQSPSCPRALVLCATGLQVDPPLEALLRSCGASRRRPCARHAEFLPPRPGPLLRIRRSRVCPRPCALPFLDYSSWRSHDQSCMRSRCPSLFHCHAWLCSPVRAPQVLAMHAPTAGRAASAKRRRLLRRGSGSGQLTRTRAIGMRARVRIRPFQPAAASSGRDGPRIDPKTTQAAAWPPWKRELVDGAHACVECSNGALTTGKSGSHDHKGSRMRRQVNNAKPRKKGSTRTGDGTSSHVWRPLTRDRCLSTAGTNGA